MINQIVTIAIMLLAGLCLCLWIMWVSEKKMRLRSEAACRNMTESLKDMQIHLEALKKIAEARRRLEKRIEGAETHEEMADIFNYIRDLNNSRVQDDARNRCSAASETTEAGNRAD